MGEQTRNIWIRSSVSLLATALVLVTLSGATQEQERGAWRVELTLIGWSGKHVITADSSGAYAFKRVRLGEVHDQGCASLSVMQLQALNNDMRLLSNSLDGLRRTWPSEATDSQDATLDILWPETGESAQFRLPRLPPPIADPAPDFILDLMDELWTTKDLAQKTCDAP